jgi:hypothetical protein
MKEPRSKFNFANVGDVLGEFSNATIRAKCPVTTKEEEGRSEIPLPL